MQSVVCRWEPRQEHASARGSPRAASVSCPDPARPQASPLTALSVECPETTAIKIGPKSQGSSLASDRLHPCTELHKDAKATADQTWKPRPGHLPAGSVCDLCKERLPRGWWPPPAHQLGIRADGSGSGVGPAPGVLCCQKASGIREDRRKEAVLSSARRQARRSSEAA